MCPARLDKLKEITIYEILLCINVFLYLATDQQLIKYIYILLDLLYKCIRVHNTIYNTLRMEDDMQSKYQLFVL